MADPSQEKEIVISFDATGSMYTILTSVRRNVSECVNRMYDADPHVRMGVVTHGDYIDETPERKARRFYLAQSHELSSDRRSVTRFVNEVGPSGGCGPFAAYEHVLNMARGFNWTSDKSKALVLIGDEPPHEKNDFDDRYQPRLHNPMRLDWRNEARMLQAMGVRVYAVQALSKSYATNFYKEIAAITGGYYLTLDQFDSISEILEAIAYREVSPERLDTFEDELSQRGRMTRNLDRVIGTLRGRKPEQESKFSKLYGTSAALDSVTPGRFQILHVAETTVIREFVDKNYLQFEPGKGFYELSKSEKIQDYKEIVLQDKLTGDMFTGRKARDIVGLPQVGEVNFTSTRKPWADRYRVFVQSTSYTRKLVGDTHFLYEVKAD